MLYRLIPVLICLCLAQSALAGPWLREKGSTFSAVSFASTYNLETAATTFLEYGLTDKTTLVADIGMARLQNSPDGGYITLSFRRAIGSPDRPSKLAYEIGAGVGWIGDETLPHIRTGLTWGRGMTWGEKSGWVTVEGAIVWDLTHELHVTKIDTTIGVNFSDVTSGILQLYTAHVDGKGIATIAPSVVFTPRDAKFRVQIGSESQIGDLGNSALKIGIWREF
ncbi:hypothetical protein [uncultured Sulfitobacter sp.]|uniref:hypothetical protein n=1 Tax=uncultured Sulfitobacter sp. TaxID=191468 RepID=UPI002603AB60|nr:hypothetical protein [uncultured Sulfitobacter sp.]